MGQSLLYCANPNLAAYVNADFASIGAGSRFASGLTEAQVQTVFGVAGRIGGITTVGMNNSGTVRSLKSRLNGVDGTIAISAADTTTGNWSDTTNFDTLAQADKYCFELLLSTGTPIPFYITAPFTAATKHATVYNTSRGGQAKTTVTAWYRPVSGAEPGTQATEANAQSTIRQAGTAQYLYAYISANAGTTTVITSRKNTGAGSMTLSVGSGATGMFTDTTHTDSLVSGDRFNYLVTQATTTSITYQGIGCTIVNSAGNNTNDIFGAASGTTGISTTTKRFAPIAGASMGNSDISTNEIQIKAKLGFAVTITRLRLFVVSNATTAGSVVTFRQNGADGNQTFTIGSGATGFFEDTTHTDTVAATDEVCLSIVIGSANAILISNIGSTQQQTPALPESLNISQAVNRAAVW